jgi:stringent starvation protein B
MLDWMVDCGYTPHLIVDAMSDIVRVPRQFVKDGRIVLNISASATQSFMIGAEAVQFSARFGGVSHQIHVPMDFVLGIYARETGQGMVFNEGEGTDTPPPSGTSPTPDAAAPQTPQPPKRPRPKLKVVK